MAILELFDLSGNVAFVTGSNRGLGQGMALGLAEAGADIVGLGVGDDTSTATAVRDLGRRYTYHHLDLIRATPNDLDERVAAIVAEMGGLHILVNNAGIIRRAPLLEFTEQDWDDVANINLKSLFFLSKAAARVMIPNGGGKIINVASVLSYQGGITVPAYTAAKHGVMGLTRALSNELAARHINVNAIAPGYMATDNTAPLRNDADRSEAILGRIPAGRWGSPDDLKGVTVFLASAASDYMHGATVPVDGGWLAR
jgi:2-dehydro-3-deoxy-D-gluconate 5-dehydrogenase